MEIERAGITFDVSYRGATRGGPYEPPEGAEIEVNDWHVSDWDELAACFGAEAGKVFGSVQEIADHIMERDYSDMLDDAEAQIADDFDPPDDFDEPDCFDSDLW